MAHGRPDLPSGMCMSGLGALAGTVRIRRCALCDRCPMRTCGARERTGVCGCAG